ncbi:hypothetical protein S83_014770 [Arachis hypogaea]
MKLIRSMRSSSIGKKEHIGIHDTLVIRSLESPIEMSLVGNRDRDDKRYWSLGMFFQKYVWMHPMEIGIEMTRGIGPLVCSFRSTSGCTPWYQSLMN